MEKENTEVVDVREFALKWSSKKVVYKILTITEKVYLPPVQQLKNDFIGDLIWRDKKVIFFLNL